MASWETVIGLECHVELDTKTKMFCGCRNVFGADPNTNTCPVCMGHPGSLPVPNAEAIRRIVKIGLALDSAIAPHSLFHRKNYFYPDMPKNYQISQYDLPICVGGHLDIDLADGSTKRVGITRVHMEEDTGKTTHGSESGRIHEAEYALIDYNRAGVPLVECVSEPDMRTPEEAAAYLRELRATLEVLDVSEIKNMNSIRSLERALVYETQRQVQAMEAGEPLVQETRHWDEGSGMTTSMRSKEEAFDYRYFPEPDIPPLEPSDRWIDEIRATLPELPRARRARYEALGVRSGVVRVLVADRISVALFEGAVGAGADPAPAATWITQDVAALRNAAGSDGAITARHVADIVRLVADGTISGAGAKLVLEDAFASGAEIPEIVDRLQLRQVSDAGALGALADEVIDEHPDVVEKFRGGKEGVIGFLVGQLMQKAGNAANAKVAQELLRERLQG